MSKFSADIKPWLAVSPLALFLAVYLISSLVSGDFYRIPVSSAFLTASVYALCLTKGSVEERIAVFSRGAGDGNVMLMIWIFILAGAFAATAKEIGAIDATVNLTMMIVPEKLLLAGLFLAACFVSMAMGTSVGTIVALVPIASGIAEEIAVPAAMMTAIIVGGAFFGDNLSFISDTTIAATRTQGCSMSDKFKVNIKIAGPAALLTAALYLSMGAGINTAPAVSEVEWGKLLPYLSVMVLAMSGLNVTLSLCIGIALNLAIGAVYGDMGWLSFLSSAGAGIAGMGDLITVTLLAGGMLAVIKHNGGVDFMTQRLAAGVRGKRGAEFCIAAIVSLANLCTANNTIAIITTGGIARNISERFSLDSRKTASILDTFSCIVQGIIPYGAQMLMASSLSGVSAISISRYLYYPLILFVTVCMAIIFRFPRKVS